MRNTVVDQALQVSLSRERLAKYLADCDDDLDRALSLYERNSRLAEALYGPLQSVEVCLRNALHGRMTATYGENWMQDARTPLEGGAREMVAKVVIGLSRRASPSVGAIVAELNLGFWVGLLGPGYDQSLWRITLHRAFPNARAAKRRTIQGRFNMIRRLRNRVAHHEPVYLRPLAQDHEEIIAAIGWMCQHTTAWTAHHSRLPAALEAE